MAWYRASTVTVTNNSVSVVGAGTDFVSNVSAGEAFNGPDGRGYEIAAVVSATQLTLARPYQGISAAGQVYSIQPTASFARDLALQASSLLNSFAAVRDGIGQGLVPDGTVAAPGVRFAADPDTGFYRPSANTFGVVTGGQLRVTVASNGYVGIGTSAPTRGIHISGGDDANQSTARISGSATAPGAVELQAGPSVFGISGGAECVFTQIGIGERARISSSGFLLVGTATGSTHTFSVGSTEGALVLNVNNSASFYVASNAGFSSAATAIYVRRHSTTNRSINAGGTVNASGADYAEYMTKADGCGPIAKGDVCGVDRDGRLTRTWSDAVSFVAKSTDPAYVGGDVWAADIGERPEQRDDESDAGFADRLGAWEAAFEAARLCVDRIAFAGQVPVNIDGDFAVGDYLIAAPNGGGIRAIAIAEANITFEQYRCRIGKVWAIRNGRPWVDVQHG